MDKECFLAAITLSEVDVVLKGFKKDKIPSPNGWHAKFFLDFFDLVGEYLLKAAEQDRLEGRVTKAINSTFLTLIPKCENTLTFADFRPIYLCKS